MLEKEDQLRNKDLLQRVKEEKTFRVQQNKGRLTV
jgi:hypothetical protein